MKQLLRLTAVLTLCASALAGFASHAADKAAAPADGSVLPFPPVPSASIAKPRLQDSVHKRRAEPQHLKPGAPNVLIILLDDVGFGQASTFGGEINTPTLSRLADEGISYNTFHTTAICSPTRAALLTGRNHQRVGNGTIAERAVDWDGYTGVIPKTSATIAEVLRHYGYKHGGHRQVAQHAGRPDHGDGPVRPLAHRPRLRLLLRLPGRRDLAVGAAAGREHQRHRAAARREVPPERRPGAARRRLAAPAPRLRARQALLHVLGARRRARPAPGPQGVGRQVQGQVRRRLGRLPRARLRAPEAARLDPGRHAAHAARRVHAGVGAASPSRSARSSAG